jgi:aminopeptidase N
MEKCVLSKIFTVVTPVHVRKIFRSTEDELVTDIFYTTPPMSTYLVAFIVSDFANMTAVDDNRIYKIWARADSIEQAQYGLSVTPGVIKFMETFTKIPFEFQKLDQAAIPVFSTGAMENWGLVTYRLVLVTSYC